MTMTRSTYSVKLTEALDDLRPGFKALSAQLAGLTTKRAEIAPAFIHALKLWKRETRRSFVAFVQALDPSVPAHRAGYKSHPSYNAALYLQQLVTNPQETKRRGLTPMSALAVMIKSVLPLFGSQRDQQAALEALLGATRWRDRDQARLLTAIRRAKVVSVPKVPRLVDATKTTKAAILAFERERISA